MLFENIASFMMTYWVLLQQELKENQLIEICYNRTSKHIYKWS